MSIQHYVEKNLKQAVKDYDIKNGAGAIVMDVNTGKILAMASLGGYDLNNFLDVSDEAKSVIDKASTEEEKNQLLADAQRLQWRNKTPNWLNSRSVPYALVARIYLPSVPHRAELY